VPVARIPTIATIERATAVVAIATAAVISLAFSPAAALGCLLGAALMMINLYVLTVMTRSIFAIAQQAGGATAIGLLAPPLKMLVLAGVVFLVVKSGRVNLPGFIAGSLTQFAAIFIEVGRRFSWNSRSGSVS
jgi:hypothetical protein